MVPFERVSGKFFESLFFCVILISAVGCGYRFQGTGNPIGIHIDSLAIPLVASTASYLGFEGEFTRAIREEFVSHGKVSLVSREKASAVLIGKVYEIETDPYSYDLLHVDVRGEKTTYEVTNARWLRVKLNIRLVDRDTGQIMWEDREMTEKHTYAVTNSPLDNRFNQRKALRAIARILARRIYAKTMERF